MKLKPRQYMVQNFPFHHCTIQRHNQTQKTTLYDAGARQLNTTHQHATYEASSHLPDLMIDPCQRTCKTQLHYETQHNPANLPHHRNHATHIQIFCHLTHWKQRNLLARLRRVEQDPILIIDVFRND
jgi:hypothetical protein